MGVGKRTRENTPKSHILFEGEKSLKWLYLAVGRKKIKKMKKVLAFCLGF